MRRACWALTFCVSTSCGSATARAMAFFVISLKTMRRIGLPAFARWFAMCQAMASPSRSRSVASRTASAFLAASSSSLSTLFLPRMTVYSGANPFSMSTPSLDLGRSMT